jgi:hypothetical protein
MKRIALTALFSALLVVGWIAQTPSSTAAATGISGQGDMKFRVLYTSSILPAKAQAVLKNAHGGFAVDRRPGKGETYFALPGAGILQISSDLKSVKLLNTDADMAAQNMHNATIWQAPGGTHYLTFPGNGSAKVYTTTLDGKLVNTLDAPTGGQDLGLPLATDYFKGGGNFVPTDVEYLDGLFYITTGYSNLDAVITARVQPGNMFQTTWHDLSFGGRGTGPGQFGTGHGISIEPGTKRIDVTDRLNAEIDRFTRYGQYLDTVNTPLGSMPCDIDYDGKYVVSGVLRGPDRSKGAPVYIMENDRLISTVMVKEDLGLENFTHIHNTTMRHVDGKAYLIVQAWNPGDFAILEQVTN